MPATTNPARYQRPGWFTKHAFNPIVAGLSSSTPVEMRVRNAAWVSGTASDGGVAVVVAGRTRAIAPSPMIAPSPSAIPARASPEARKSELRTMAAMTGTARSARTNFRNRCTAAGVGSGQMGVGGVWIRRAGARTERERSTG